MTERYGINIEINLGRVPGVMRSLQNQEGFERGVRVALLHLQSKFNTYPRHTPRAQSQHWTDRQRRGFFARLRSGEIEVPYVRGFSPNSERLGQRWTLRGSGYGARLTNNASYASLVQGRQQTAYHRQTGWKTVEDTLREERNTIGRLIGREMRRDV